MRNPKHRWTLEEENALRAGVDKYGTGKWRKILSDEEFAPRLTGRSNVDLKDKWRNLCGNASRRVASPRCLADKETGPRYNPAIFEALSSEDNSEGLNVDAMHNYTQNVVGEAVEEAEVKFDEAFVRDYVQVLREVGYKEHEINVAVEHTEVVHEEAVDEHVGVAMSMNIEDSQDTGLIKDSQNSILKPKLLQKLVFKALKKLSVGVKDYKREDDEEEVGVEDTKKLQMLKGTIYINLKCRRFMIT